MRILFMLSLSIALASPAFGQAATPATQKPTTQAPAKPAQPAPAQPAPAQPKPAPTPTTGTPPTAPRRATTGRSGMAITVTDNQGTTIPNVRVDVDGPTERNGQTDGSGQLSFPGLQPATYRLRFSGDEVVTFEREVTLRPGQIADLDIMLNRAPKPEPAAAPPTSAPPPAAADLGPTGAPQTLSVVEVLEKNFVAKQPRRETLLSCSANTRSTMIQLNEPQPERLYADADAVYYVLGGEGVIRINGKETKIGTNGFASVPRGTAHSFERRGNRALVLLAVLSGEPCEAAK